MESTHVKSFTYLKENGGVKKYQILKIKDLDTVIEGVSLEALTEQEKEALVTAHAEYLKALQPYMKYYRKFLKSGIKA